MPVTWDERQERFVDIREMLDGPSTTKREWLRAHLCMAVPPGKRERNVIASRASR